MNPRPSHKKRPQLERSGVIRNRVTPQPPVPAEAGAPREPIAAVGAAVCGVLENGVRTAYKVIDDYMRRGQDTARTIFNDPNRRGTMSDDKGNFQGGGFNPMNPMAMFTEQWMTAMRAWSQAWSAFTPGGWPMQGMNPFAATGGVAPRVSVKVSSASPVEVSANLFPGTDSAGLVSEPLRADGFVAPPIDAPGIVREAGIVRVSVHVGSKQPKGRYIGSIRRKADGSAAGDLTVIVS
jgi:hypothetical protein